MDRSDLEGLSAVVTGRIAGDTRQSAEAQLRECGAFVQSSVTSSTQLLLTGEAVGATKINKAKAQGVEVRSWSEVMLGGPAPGPPARLAEKARPARPLAVKQIAPMLAQAADEPPSGEGWQYEIKWDGYRCIAHCTDGGVVLRSRSGKPLSFPQIEAELAALPICILDGEVVVLDTETGGTNFQALGDGHTGASYVIFDVLEVEGVDVRGRQWTERRSLLDSLLPDPKVWIAPSPVFDDGEQLIEYARERKLEGIVAKRMSSTYQEGSRGPAWRKIKVRCEQEFVVVGWTPGKNGNIGRLGALVLGYYEPLEHGQIELVYAGKVGTGFTDAEGLRLLQELEDRAFPVSELGEKPSADLRDAEWVDPTMVVQVQFQRWTDDGRLWHPSYKGQRIDKAPEDVRKEAIA